MVSRLLLGATLLLAGNLPAQPGRQRDSVEAARYIARIRRQENRFLADWRFEWLKHRDLKGTSPRYWSLHCHYDDYELGDENHVITTHESRKSMCPIWFQEEGTRGDESAWIDNGIPEKSRPKIREKRAAIIAMLDTAFVKWPTNEWVTGQRVRLLVDQREFDRATDVATRECALSTALCAMLEAYVLTSRGFSKGGEAMYEYAMASMTPSERCGLLDPSLLLESESRKKYTALTCAARVTIDATYWWLADPLFLQPRNERLAAHLHRQTLLMLHAALTADEHFDYRPARGGLAVAEMITRYGWPSVQFYNRTEDENHNGWLGWKDSASNSSREYFAPRYHTTLDYEQVVDIRKIDGRSFRDLSQPWLPTDHKYDPNWWPLEHFARPGPLKDLDFQAAAFRRARTPLLAVAMDGRALDIDRRTLGQYTNGIAAMRGPTDSAVPSTHAAELLATGALVSVADLEAGLQIVSAELLRSDRDSAPAFRSRFAVDAPPGLDALARAEIALSDILLYSAPASSDSIPKVAGEAIARMLPSTDLASAGRVGVFFELYGIPAGAAVELTLTVAPIDQPGLFRRLGSRLGVVDPGTGSFVMRWRADQPQSATTAATIGGVPMESRSIVVDLSTLRSGRYALEIGARRPGETGVVSRREFTLRR